MNKFAKAFLISITLISCSSEGQVCARQIKVPEYPPIAFAAGWKGIVDLDVTIGAQGQVIRVDGKGSFPLLVEQSEKNVKDWVFCAIQNDNSTHVQLRYDYRVEGVSSSPQPATKVVIDLEDATILIKLPPVDPDF